MIVVTIAAPAAAQQSEKAELAAYRLTSDKLDRYAAANRSLAQVMKDHKNDPDAAKSENDGDSISGAVRHLDKIAPAAAAIRSAGLTTREYVMTGFAILSSAMVVEFKRNGTIKEYPDTVNKANAEFVEQNYDKIKAIMAILPDASK